MNCEVHTTRLDEDCEICKSEITQKTQNLQIIADQNNKLVKEIARQGGRVDPNVIADLRISLLLRALLTSRQIIDFETRFHQELHGTLNDIQTELRKAKLVAPPINLDRRRKR